MVMEKNEEAAINRLRQIRPNEPDPATLDRIWRRVAQGTSHQVPYRAPSPRRIITLRWATAAIALILVILSALGWASASALPDSPLYPIKRVREAVQWQLAVSQPDRARLALSLADLHFSEAETLVAKGASPELSMQALKDSLAYLDAAANFGLKEEITERLREIQRQVRAWPPDYQVAAKNLLETWFQKYPNLIPEPGEIPQPVTPTALPPIPTPALPIPSPTSGAAIVTPTSLLPLVTPTPIPLPIAPTLQPPVVIPSVPPLPLPTLRIP